MNKPPRHLGVLALIMLNLVAVDSLRNLPIGATYGPHILGLYLLMGVFFLVPLVWVSTLLATRFPQRGGIYVWIRQAFGPHVGLWVSLLQWLYNLFWFPTILSFIASTFAHLFLPQWQNNAQWLTATTLLLFWLTTFINTYGMKYSAWVATAGALLGTLLPMFILIGMGLLTLWQHHGIQTPDWNWLLPTLQRPQDWPYLSAVLFGMLGLEMSATHADEVKDPERTFPRALWGSAIGILLTLSLSTAAINIILPQKEIHLMVGLIVAFEKFYQLFHLPTLAVSITAAGILLGSLASLSAWIIGPTKSLQTAAIELNGPTWLVNNNTHGVPAKILAAQAVIFSLLASTFLLVPEVSGAYWLLSALTATLALVVYFILFLAAWKLYQPESLVQCCINQIMIALGLFSTTVGILVGFIQPAVIHPIPHFVALCLAALLTSFAACAWPVWYQWKR